MTPPVLTKEEFEDLVEKWHVFGLELMTRKNADYAGAGDVLQDFYRLHILCSVLHINPAKRPEDTARFMMLVKLDRDANLIGRSAQNESRMDTLQDLHNYLYLYRAMLEVMEE
jgi:hypothetical protein